jgi:hypothetical protein
MGRRDQQDCQDHGVHGEILSAMKLEVVVHDAGEGATGQRWLPLRVVRLKEACLRNGWAMSTWQQRRAWMWV